MIKSLQVTNFQSHKNTKLDFCPRVNVVIGESDSGKSAIIRSLRWLFQNRPTGTAYRSHWCTRGSKTEVTIVPSNAPAITRKRTISSNEYIYAGENGDVTLEAVRSDVPAEISALCNMDELINLQQQGDRPFLLDESPPEVARILNTIVGLDNIDSAHTRIAGKIRENQDNVRTTTTCKKQLEDQLEGYVGLEDLEEQVKVVDALCSEQDRLEKRFSILGGILTVATPLEQSVEATRGLPAIVESAKKCGKLLESNKLAASNNTNLVTIISGIVEATRYTSNLIDIHKIEKNFSQLSKLAQQYNVGAERGAMLDGFGRLVYSIQTAVDSYANLPIDTILANIPKLITLQKSVADMEKQDLLLVAIGRNVSAVTAWLDNCNKEIIQLESKLDGMVCPTCGTAKGNVRK